MDQESREKFRLSAQEQEEIGDILMSARAVSHQMIAQAQEKIDAMLLKAQERAAQIEDEAGRAGCRRSRGKGRPDRPRGGGRGRGKGRGKAA